VTRGTDPENQERLIDRALIFILVFVGTYVSS